MTVLFETELSTAWYWYNRRSFQSCQSL